MKILALCGSLRENSWNKKLLEIAIKAAEESGAEVTTVNLNEYPLPYYNQDLEEKEGVPENASLLKELFLSHQGLLIASPEYNGSFSASIKNTIDWVSRKTGKETDSLEALKGKFAVIMSTSIGEKGGIKGLLALQSFLYSIGVTVISPYFSLGNAETAFEGEKLKNKNLQENLEQKVKCLSELLSRLVQSPFPFFS